MLYVQAYADGRPGWRGLFSPLLLPPSGWRELVPSVRTRNRHMLHTQQKEQALEWQCLQKDHVSPLCLLVEAQIQSPRGEAALTTHQHSSFPDPTGVWLSSKCVGLLPTLLLLFHTLLQAGEQTGCHAAVLQRHSCQLSASVHEAMWYFLCPSGETILQSSGTRMQVSLHLYNVQMPLNIFLPQGIAVCLMKPANLPAPQAPLIRHL